MLLVAGGLVLLVLAGGSSYPAATLLVVLATFAIGPQWLAQGVLPHTTTELFGPLQKGLLLLSLLLWGLKFGLRLNLCVPILTAIGILGASSLVFADRPEALTEARVVLAAFGLAAPLLATGANLSGPVLRFRIGLLIVLLPVLCIALGVILHGLDLRALTVAGGRLQGASNAGWLGFIAYVGFAVALHEATQRRPLTFATLALVNVAIAVFSGGRMAVFACVTHLLAYGTLSPVFRDLLGRAGWVLLFLIGASLPAVVFSVPLLQERMIESDGSGLNLSGRGNNWTHSLQMFLDAPVFGKGLGASEIVRSYFDLPHNEYLRLLADGGLFGATVMAIGTLVWARALLRRTPASDGAFVHAAIVSLAVFALTDNVLLMPCGMIPFLWFAVLSSNQSQP